MADAPDIQLQAEGLSIQFRIAELEDRYGSIKFEVTVHWLERGRASWSDACWIDYEALDAFGDGLRNDPDTVLRDLSANPVLAVTADDRAGLRISCSTVVPGYGEGETSVKIGVARDVMRTWGDSIRDFPRWW
jgi:hypothetical protein